MFCFFLFFLICYYFFFFFSSRRRHTRFCLSRGLGDVYKRQAVSCRAVRRHVRFRPTPVLRRRRGPRATRAGAECEVLGRGSPRPLPKDGAWPPTVSTPISSRTSAARSCC